MHIVPQRTDPAQPYADGGSTAKYLDKLKAIPNWVCWKYVERKTRNGQMKRVKLPICPYTGKAASSSDPSTWGTYEQAVHFAKRNQWIDGIGFVLTPELGIVAIDIDDCIDDNGNLSPMAREIVEILDGYVEISPSGRGIRILVFGSIPKNHNKRDIGLEIYASGQYVTVTFDHLPGAPADVVDRTEQLATVYDLYFTDDKDDQPAEQPQAADLSVIPGDDQELIRRMLASRNGDKLRKLWAGDWSDYPTQSEGDLALCNAFAYWTARDKDRIDRLFRQSGLMRDKWDYEPYRSATLAKALQVSSVYQPTRANKVEFTGEFADLLLFAIYCIAERRFIGRSAENQQRIALSAVQILRKQGDTEGPLSLRHLSVLSGTSHGTVDSHLLGSYKKNTKERGQPSLCWLVEKQETGNGIGANIYRLSAEILEKYQNNVRSNAPAVTIPKSILTIEQNMTDDAFARNSTKHRREASDQRPDEGWISDSGSRQSRLAGLDHLLNVAVDDSLLKSFTPIGLRIIAELEGRPGACASLGDLADSLDKHPSTISAAVKRMGETLERNQLEPVLLVAQDENDARRKLVVLSTDWRQRVSAARPKLMTDGINRARNLYYAQERILRLKAILRQARNPEIREMCERIIEGAKRVQAFNEGRLEQLHQAIDAAEVVIQDATPAEDLPIIQRLWLGDIHDPKFGTVEEIYPQPDTHGAFKVYDKNFT